MMSDVLSLGNLGEAAVRSLLMAGCVGLALTMLRVRNVATQKLAWTLVLAGSLAMPFANPWAKAHVDTLPAILQVDAGRLTAFVERVRPDAPAVHEVIGAQVSEAPSVEPANGTPGPVEMHFDFTPLPSPAAPASILRWPQFAFLGYTAVAMLLFLRVLAGLFAALRLWMAATPSLLYRDEFPGLPVRMSTRVVSPVTIGSGVLLPFTAAQWDARKLRIVLAHEGSHVRNGDFYIQLCAELYAVLFWFSPLGWWLRRKLCALNETLSDGAAVREASSHASYARLLLEFAAMPRTSIGVAMARHASLSARIERLLDESRFRQAFTASPRRKLVAGMLLPVVLCVAAALLQPSVHAAVQQPVAPPPPANAQPETAKAPKPAVPAEVVPVEPPQAAIAVPSVAPAPPTGSVDAVPAIPQTPEVGAIPAPSPAPKYGITLHSTTMNDDGRMTYFENEKTDGHSSNYAYSSHWGDSDEFYVLASKGWDNISCCGWMGSRTGELKKARSLAHGDFLWFSHDGKSYIVDDSQTIAQLKQMYDPITELGQKQRELGQQQRSLGEQQRELGRQMREQTRIEKPDISREMAELNASVEALKADKTATISQQKLADMQAKLAALQAKLGSMQGQFGDRMGVVGAQQGKLGEMQGRLGREQGRLGEEQGRLAREADRKVRSVIEESLKNGKARPVQ